MAATSAARLITLHFDDSILTCEANTNMSRPEDHGYFVADTRFVSGYRLKLEGLPPVLLDARAPTAHSARFEMTNLELVTAIGPLPARALHLRLDRTLGHGVHDDYDIVNQAPAPVDVVLEVSLECDFADLFDVKDGRLPRRGSLQTTWSPERGTLTTRYRNGDFERALVVAVERASSEPEYANGGIAFPVRLGVGERWHACLRWIPEVDGRRPSHAPRACHDLLGQDTVWERERAEWVRAAARFHTDDPDVTHAVRAAVESLSSLRLHRHDRAAAGTRAEVGPPAWVPAAGVPWFVTLFGRDSLVVSLQTLALSWRFAQGALEALGTFQADGYDDERDMQPGKVVHEIRHGELAHLRLIPHTPYYGTHDATSLFVWAAARAWCWHGDRQLLDRARPHVERALAWIDTDGDIDGDGLQEYRTRASFGGYRNQGWKDAGDAVVAADGSQAPLPIALCELQGYVVAAKRGWADVLADAYGELDAATRLRSEAARLADLIEERFWWEDEQTYVFGLDGDKRPIRSVASNPGHLLWAAAIEPERARQVADRLLAEDMWSGWGVRTLSARHPAYDPFSYQRGSVWPHDNAAFATGCRRYGLDRHAAQVARAVLDTAIQLDGQLPELIAGTLRDRAGFPVPYADANVPQAWASGALVQLLTAMLGPVPDASRRALVLHPALPPWLGELTVSNLGVGASTVDVTVRRDAAGAHTVEATTVSGDLIDVDHEVP